MSSSPPTASRSNSEAFQPIGLGDRVKDPITGLSGIVTCVSVFLNGCIRCGVQPEIVVDGKPAEDRYFDQAQLLLIDRGVHKPLVLTVAAAPEPPAYRSPGGPVREGARFRR